MNRVGKRLGVLCLVGVLAGCQKNSPKLEVQANSDQTTTSDRSNSEAPEKSKAESTPNRTSSVTSEKLAESAKAPNENRTKESGDTRPDGDAKPAKGVASAPPPASAPIPASAQEIAAVLDLARFPRLKGAVAFFDTPTLVHYSAKGTLADADALMVSEMKKQGWTELEDSIPTTATYSDRRFVKDGFHFRMTMSQSGGDDEVSVSLSHLGNIDVRALPRLDDAEPMSEPEPTGITYATQTTLDHATQVCRERLTAAGWREIADFGPDLPASPHYRGFNVVNRGLRIMVAIAYSPDDAKKKVSVSYLASEAMPFDLPIAVDADHLKFDMLLGNAEYESKESMAKLNEFFRSTAAEQGWKIRAPESAGADDPTQVVAFLLEDPRKLGFFVKLSSAEGKSRVELERLSFAETPKEVDNNAAVAQTEADSPEAKPDSDEATPDNGLASNATDEAKVATDDAVREELKKVRKTFKGLGKDLPEGALDQIDEALGDDQNENDEDNADDDDDMDDEESGDDRPAVAESETPAAPQKIEAFGEVDEASIANSGTKLIARHGESKVELRHAVAFWRKSGDKLTPSIVFSAKPISPAKLKRALASGEDVSAFDLVEGFTNSCQLGLDDSFTTLNCSLDTTSLSVSSSKIKSAFKVENGRIRGQVSYTEDDNEKPVFIEATFDLEMQEPVSTSGAKESLEALARNSEVELPWPAESKSHSQEGSRYRQVVSGEVESPLASVLEFYRREFKADGWRESSPTAAESSDTAEAHFTADGQRATLHAKHAGGVTTIELIRINDEQAKKDGIQPAKGKSRIVLGNAFSARITIDVDGKKHALAAESGVENPTDAIKLEVKPGKHAIRIQPKQGQEFEREVDVSPNTAWGVIVISEDDAIIQRLY